MGPSRISIVFFCSLIYSMPGKEFRQEAIEALSLMPNTPKGIKETIQTYPLPGMPKKALFRQEAIEALSLMPNTPKGIKETVFTVHREHGISVTSIQDVIAEMNSALEGNLDLVARQDLYRKSREWTEKCGKISIFYFELEKTMRARIKENPGEPDINSKYLLPIINRGTAYSILVTAFLIQAHKHYQTLRSSTKEDQKMLTEGIKATLNDIEALKGIDFVTELGISPNNSEEARSKLLKIADTLEGDLSDSDTDSTIEEVSEDEAEVNNGLDNIRETRITIE